MSLLGPPERLSGWVPLAAQRAPECDDIALSALIHAAAEIVRRGGRVHALGVAVADATAHLSARLAEGRREAAEVRYALGLPMTAGLPEVLAAIGGGGR